MALNRNDDRQIDPALGDNNCAFNAIILGTFNPDVLAQLEQSLQKAGKLPDVVFAVLIEAIALRLNIPSNWSAVKNAVLALDKQALQKTLAPIMRKLAIDLASQDPSYAAQCEQALLSAFDIYAYRRIGLPAGNVKEDIYLKHSFISRFFEKLLHDQFVPVMLAQEKHHAIRYQSADHVWLLTRKELAADEAADLQIYNQMIDKALDAVKQEVKNWWSQTGKTTFLDVMKRNGEWAGDLELSQLAKYFDFNLDVRRGHFTHRINHANGFLPDHGLDKKAQIDQLVVRQVINKDQVVGKGYPLFEMTPDTLSKRLSEVPEYQKVSAFIAAHPANLKSQPVPADWSQACVEELKKRDVVSGKQFAVSAEDAMPRVREIQDRVGIEAAWHKNYKNPVNVTLANLVEGHWDNTLPAIEKKPAPTSPQLVSETISLFAKKHAENEAAKASPDHKPKKSKLRRLKDKANRHVKSPHMQDSLTSTYFFKDDKQVTASLAGPAYKEIKVTKEMQLKLDEELAMQLQMEEYKKYLCPR